LTLFRGGNQVPDAASDNRASGLVSRFPPIALVLVGGLLVRVLIAYVIAPGQGLQADLDYFKNAALTMADYGPGGFVLHNGFYQPSPVGYLYFLWPLGAAGRFLGGLLGQPADGITYGLLKIPAILADLGIALLLYRTARRWFDTRTGLIAAALYLFIPVTWYESALFGQVDSVGLVFLLGALLLVLEGWSEPAVAMAVIAAVIKPQNALVLVIIGPILLRRHLFAVGSGPIPTRRSRFALLDRMYVDWFARRQGFVRLVSCAAVAVVVFVVAILPFDLELLAPPGTVTVPVVGNISGFLNLLGSLSGYYHFLTVDAFNAWALVGPMPLFSEMSRTFIWTFDSLAVIGPVQAVTIGALLLALTTIVVAVVLLLRDDRAAILTSFTMLALAFFALPTRVHERYQFPVFVVFALLVAGRSISERRWRWWYIALGVLAAVNLHAVATLAKPGFATPGLIGAPLGDLFRSDAVVIAVSVANTLLFLVVLLAWARGVAWPAFTPLVQRIAGAAAVGATPLAPRMLSEPEEPPIRPTRQPPRANEAKPGGIRELGSALSRFGETLWRPIRGRLNRGSPPVDNTADLANEGGGLLDKRDLWVVIAILVVTFAVRAYRIDQPRAVYFDELYYATTGTEFLQYWRYGIKTEIFEYTHPHISKYAQAMSLAAFGNDRVTGVAAVGAPVRDVAFDPAFSAPGVAGGYGGDRIAIATGSEVRIAPHGVFDQAIVVPLPGAQLVAFDRATHRLYAADAAGVVWVIDGAALDAAFNGGAAAPQPVRVAGLGKQISHLLVIAADRVVVVGAGGELTLLNGANGKTLATTKVPGLSGLVALPVGGHIQVAVASMTGLLRLDGASLAELSRLELPARALGIEFVDGSDFGWRNQSMLPVPTLYVALDSKQLAAVQVGPDGSLTLFDLFAMPGPVSELHWDRPSNMLHVLGRTAAGVPTIYVVEPHTDSVFADAPLPFQPTAWMLDAQPDTPSLDRQHALAFAADGNVAIVDTGSHGWAWRLPGLIAGTLTAALMYLLTRMLFRRRMVAVLLAIVMALDGLMFIQGRIAMNDSLLGFFIVYAFWLLLSLVEARPRGPGRWLIPLVGLPVVGGLLGLALATKWVGAYAIGGAVLLVLSRTRVGRWLALGGLVLITGVFGFQAIAGQPPNFTFLILMVGLTMFTGVLIVRSAPDAPHQSRGLPSWVDPARRYGIPFALAMVCLLIIPVVVYVISYIPWALADHANPQLFAGWPPGHTGPTFLDMQSQMYHYHNDLRTPHAASSPWWAWPFGLKPVWGYFDTFSNGTQALMLLTANPILLWMGVPAIGFGVWQAWRRRSVALAFVLIAFFSLWLPWVRIDRVAFNYHWYTPLLFGYVLLAYFLAELWHGPSRRTWSLARVAFALVLLAPALLWISKDGLCALAGVSQINPTSFECSRSVFDVLVPVGIWLVGSAIAAWFILAMQNPRRLVLLVVAAAAVGFAVLYPALSALPIPNGWPFIYQGLLPTWDISFQFNSNTSPVVQIPLLGVGAVVVGAVAAGLAWFAMRRVRVEQSRRLSPAAAGSGAVAVLPPGSTEGTPATPPVAAQSPVSKRARAAPRAGQEAPSTSPEVVEPPAVLAPNVRRAGLRAIAVLQESPIDSFAIPIGLFLLATLVYAFVNQGRPATLNYFVPLADALLHGQLGLSAAFSWLGEVVLGPNGLYNVPYPPAPSVLLMPFVLIFGAGIDQVWVSVLIGALNVALISLILDEMEFSRLMRVVLSLVFGFGTIVWYSAQNGTAWHFSHVSSIFFMLLTILACQRNARPWVIGLLFGGAVLSRLALIAAGPFLIAYLAYRTQRQANRDLSPFGIRVGTEEIRPVGIDTRAFVRLAAPMALGLAIPLAAYLAYNQLRFGSMFETGTLLIPGLLQSDLYRDGLFTVAAIPRNLVAMFLALPIVSSGFPYLQPPYLGSLSIILTTPLLLWVVRARPRDWFTVGCWASAGLLLAISLLRADPGGVQFGFRYAQDFYPFVFLLAARGLNGRIGRAAWVAIGIGFAVNLWGMGAAIFNWWA
jgi:dolichyl-phosphate-mannose--protein O-mannosyl transferase